MDSPPGSPAASAKKETVLLSSPQAKRPSINTKSTSSYFDDDSKFDRDPNQVTSPPPSSFFTSESLSFDSPTQTTKQKYQISSPSEELLGGGGGSRESGTGLDRTLSNYSSPYISNHNYQYIAIPNYNPLRYGNTSTSLERHLNDKGRIRGQRGGGGGIEEERDGDDEDEHHFLQYPHHHPIIEDDENDLYKSLSRRQSSLLWNRIVSYGVFLTLFASFVVVIVLVILKIIPTSSQASDDDYSLPPNTCYLEPSCPDVFLSPQYNQETGFTNFTGWNDMNSGNGCCNICPIPSISKGIVIPFDGEVVSREVSSIQGRSFIEAPSHRRNSSFSIPESTEPRSNLKADPVPNFDYLVFDQIWLPQWCNALLEGHDPTLSHLSSSSCYSAIYSSSSNQQLVIHGLWPNKEIGSAICCSSSDNERVATLNPTVVQTWTIYSELTSSWFDPTTDMTYYNSTYNQEISCSTCYLLNHEWQKHGSCFALPNDLRTVEENQFHYFESGLVLNTLLADPTSAINKMNGTIVSRIELENLYSPYVVNVMCDPQDSYNNEQKVGIFLEIQTCWDLNPSYKPNKELSAIGKDIGLRKDEERDKTIPRSKRFSSLNHVNKEQENEFTMVNCEKVVNSNYSSLCPDQVFIRNFLTQL
jgi:ribonuclease I